MNTHFPKKAKDIKGPVAIAELCRAHYIIAMLSIALAVVIGFVAAFELRFDAVLAIVAITLLALVAGVSIGTACVLPKR